MPNVVKLGRVATAAALALGITANANAANVFVWSDGIINEASFLINDFDVTSLTPLTVTLTDNNFLAPFDTLALAITPTGSPPGSTLQQLTSPSSLTFTPTQTGNYTAILFGDPGAVNGNTFSSFGVTVAAVPEAETWAMMLVGMGLVGWQLRRKVKASAASRFV